MIKRRIQIDAMQFPDRIRKLLQNANVYDSSCNSDALVYYADTGYYIKMDAAGRLAGEAELGRRFHSRGLGVELVDYISDGRDYLVTRSAVGEDLTHCLNEPRKLCEILAGALRRLHETPIDGLPVSAKIRQYADSLQENGGDAPVSMNRYHIHTRDEARKIAQEGGRLLTVDTAIHGDACLPNVIQNEGRFSSFIDFAMAGRGDRHIDLYWALWSLRFNLKTDAWADCLLDAYGRDGFSDDLLRVVAAYELLG